MNVGPELEPSIVESLKMSPIARSTIGLGLEVGNMAERMRSDDSSRAGLVIST